MGTVELQEAPAVANNDVVSLQITLPQMLDLALGTPEIGVVNLNILHNLLHVVLRQLNLQTIKVEYRGENADRIKTMITSLKPGPSLRLHEYSITDGISEIVQPIQRDEEMDVEVLAEGAELTEDDLKVTKGVKHYVRPGKDTEAETVIFVEPVVNGAPPTALAFKELEQSVKQLQQQYQALEELSSTPEVIERLKGRITDPVADVWQVININKRLDANEQGIDKLTTMLQDVIKGDISVPPTADMSLINARLNELEDKVSKIQRKLAHLQAVIADLSKDRPLIVSDDNDVTPTVTAKPTAIDEMPDMDVTAEEREPTAVYDMDVVTVDELPEKEVITAEIAEPVTINKILNMNAITRETVAVDEAFVPPQEKEEITNVRNNEEIPEVVPDKQIPNEISIREIRQDINALKKDVVEVQQELRDLNEKVAQIKTLTKITAVDMLAEPEGRITIEAIINTLQKDMDQVQQELRDLNEKVAQIKTPTKITAVDMPAEPEGRITIEAIINTLQKDMDQVQQDLRDLNEKVAQIETPTKITAVDMPAEPERRITIEAIINTLQKDMDQVQQDLQDLNEKVAQIETLTKIMAVGAPPERDEVSDAANLERCLEAVKNVETTHSEALRNITERMITLEKEINNLLQKMDSVEAKTDDTAIKEFVAKIGEIETDMEKLGQTMEKLLDEKEERETHINTLLTQIEILRSIKADKEDIEDALADKADTQTVNRKVSHDRFDAACDDLTRGLEDAIDKLTKQELGWQQALDEMQNEIASKVDKIEITPLQDFIHKKLKSLQEKLKIMAETRREIEAAGTKKQLKDVQCISCDKDVVMKMEEVNRFRLDALPCTTSIKPYLTYELDQVRKRQRRLPHSRNMIQFEAAMQEEAKKMKTPREEIITKIPKDHLCNRYCGGSHTITTPQQRVTRMGHFLTQWGPEAVQLTDGLIEGKDGQMYRSRPMAKVDVSRPTWKSQTCEETHPPERIASASAPTRKSLPKRRNSAGSQRRNLRKSSKEPEKYPKILENIKKISEDIGKFGPTEKPDVEIPLQESNNRPSPIQAEPQDKIIFYDTME